MKIVAGIDVGKRELVVSVSGGPVRSFKNEAGGILSVGGVACTEGVEQVVCEATGATSGGWSRVKARGLAVHRAHPSRVRSFAQASGQGAKTPRRCWCSTGKWRGSRCGTAPRRSCGRWWVGGSEQRVAERNRLEKGLGGASGPWNVAWLSRGWTRPWQALVDGHPQFSQLAGICQSVSGVGALTAATLLAHLPERPGGRQGHDRPGRPPRQRPASGSRAIRGGRQKVRRALYMAALAAIRSTG